ncbi:MAG: hypothetical protein OHK0017_02100 [Patescibacteria group bacterium]
MSTENILLIAQTVCLVLAGGLILMQQRGAGLSGVLGGSDQVYMTRRGVEKWVMVATVALIVGFCALRIASFYFGN